MSDDTRTIDGVDLGPILELRDRLLEGTELLFADELLVAIEAADLGMLQGLNDVLKRFGAATQFTWTQVLAPRLAVLAQEQKREVEG